MRILKEGMAAAPIELPDLHGREVTFAPAGRTPKVVVFYKITCPACQFAMPYYDRLHRAFSQKGVPVRAIVQNPPAEAIRFAAEYAVEMPQLVDAPAYVASRAYGVMSVPALFVIGTEGDVALASTGFVRDDLQRAAALVARAIGQPEPRIFGAGEDVPALKPG